MPSRGFPHWLKAHPIGVLVAFGRRKPNLIPKGYTMMGNRHSLKNCFAIILGVVLLVPTALRGATGRVTVAWDPIDDPDVGGYTVVWGENSRAYTGAQSVGITSEAGINLEAGKTYYLA